MLQPAPPCVGILYCGDLGAALGRLLRKTGVRVVTTCAGRTRRTNERALAAGIEILPALNDVVRAAQLVISAVVPDAAESVAQSYVDRLDLAPPSRTFVDVNSISVPAVSRMSEMFDDNRTRFVDAAVHGGAARLEELGVLYVSGRDTAEFEALFRRVMRIHFLGTEAGQATRLKLLMSGVSKSLNVLFLEIGVLAQRAGLLEQYLPECRQFYPGIMDAVERMLPTYPQHAVRRVTELRNIEELARSVESPHRMLQAARETLQAVSDQWTVDERKLGTLSIPEVIQAAAELGATGNPKERQAL